MTWVLGAVVFASVALAAYGILGLAFAEDRRVSRRLSGLTRYETAQVREAEPMLRPFVDRVWRPLADGFSRTLRAAWPTAYRDRLAVGIERAGYPRGIGVGRLVAAKALAGPGAAGLVLAGTAMAGTRAGVAIFAATVCGVLCFFAPDAWLDAQVRRRQHAIVLSLPDMLDMLTISVEAGLGFDAALAKLVRNTRGPLAQEFGRALQEVQAGASRKEALRAMAERADVSELSAFVTALVQAEVFGVSIARVLRAQSSDLRLRRRQRAEEAAQKAPVKMVVPLVFCILPATIIVVAGPAIMRIAGLFG